MPFDFTCPRCGTDFVANRKNRHFCSRACQWQTPEIRFWNSVDTSGECWIWTRGHDHFGYGTFFVENVHVTSHRYAYASRYGPIPPGKHVLHKCDNPPCVRPDHLFLGDQQSNMADMLSKGRASPPPHERGPRGPHKPRA